MSYAPQAAEASGLEAPLQTDNVALSIYQLTFAFFCGCKQAFYMCSQVYNLAAHANFGCN